MMTTEPPASLSPKTACRVDHAGWTEWHLTLPLASRIEEAIASLPADAGILSADLFGSEKEFQQMERALERFAISVPLTRVLSSAQGVGGLQLVAATGGRRKPVTLDGESVGVLVEGDEGSWLFLGGLSASDCSLSREAQTEAVFLKMERALGSVGMTFANVFRTWFYNERILEWYAGFNAVRTSYFERHGIVRMPASTGIGAPNPAGSALVAKAHALLPHEAGVGAEIVRSPLQCDAFAYGSAFSRAMMVRDSRSRLLHISGTASIEPGGESAHRGDSAAQIGLTMEVVAGILQEAGMEFSDTTRALAYFRDPADVVLWERFCRKNGLEALPCLSMGSHVCRDDLLFELELELARPSNLG